MSEDDRNSSWASSPTLPTLSWSPSITPSRSSSSLSRRSSFEKVPFHHEEDAGEMDYFMKRKRQRSKYNSPPYYSSIAIALSTLIALAFLASGLVLSSDLTSYREVLQSQMPEYRSAGQDPAHYVKDVSRFFKDVRLDNPDGLAFAQMGFRTRLYADMLKFERNSTLTDGYTRDFAQRERDMWFFLPGIEKIRKRAQSRVPNGKKKTRGIILSVDASRFIYTCHFLAMLRGHHKSSLPVEIFYMGDSDLPKSMRDHLSMQYGAVTIDLAKEDLFDDTYAQIGGYAIKPYALLATSFSEVFMTDADSVLLASPETFFNQDGYKRHGTLFFQDRLVDHKSEGGHKFILEQKGYENVSERLSQTTFWKDALLHWQESGVVVVDRSRPEVLSSLLFAAWQNGKLARKAILDRYFWGDKESYWMSFEFAGFPYYMVNHSCGAIGREHAAYANPKQGFCSEHPLHFFDLQKGERGNLVDPNDPKRKLGKPAWFNGSLRLNKYRGDLLLLDPTEDTIWAMNGTWTMHGDQWCLTNYKRFGIHEYNLGVTLGKLGRASREGEQLTVAITG